MSYYQRRLKEAQILQQGLIRQKTRNRNGRTHSAIQVQIKMAFFEDILEGSYLDIHAIWDKIEGRKKSLIQYGYWTKQGEITELGYERLIKYLLRKEQKPS